MQLRRIFTLTLFAGAVIAAVACGSGSKEEAKEALPAAQGKDAQPAAASNPVDKVDLGSEKINLVFWHTQTGPNEAKLKEVIAGFQQKYPNITVDAQYQGNYTDTYKKINAAIIGGGLPDISVAYPSMVSEFQQADVVLALDDYINSQKYGLTREELSDFFEPFLAESRYPEYGNKYYSFPFTKSVLVMYYNADRLKAEGLKVPETWDEFRAAAKKLSQGDAKGYAIRIDASTFKGMIFSRGGKVISDDQKTWKFNEQPGIDALTMLQEMVREGSAYQVAKANDDQADFAQQKTFFTLGSTAGIPFYDQAVGGRFQWGIANIPHAPGVAPQTVLYGGSITVFKTTPQKQLAAWLFIKYFSSPEVTADWATASGYMPVRKSAANSEVVKKKIAQFPPYGVALNQVVPTSKAEESVPGSQDTRPLIEDAMVAAISDLTKSPRDLLNDAVQKAQKVLKR
jgi:multiple sugar transport system substrate-binding protein